MQKCFLSCFNHFVSSVPDLNSKLMSQVSNLSPKLQGPHSVIASVSFDGYPDANERLSTFPSPLTPVDKNGSLAKADLEAAQLAETIHSQAFNGLPWDLTAGPRRRGCSVASESRSRSSSLNSVDSSSSFVTTGDQTSVEMQREGHLSSQRFSIISSEDFNQELVVKPIKVKKKKKKRLGEHLVSHANAFRSSVF